MKTKAKVIEILKERSIVIEFIPGKANSVNSVVLLEEHFEELIDRLTEQPEGVSEGVINDIYDLYYDRSQNIQTILGHPPEYEPLMSRDAFMKAWKESRLQSVSRENYTKNQVDKIRYEMQAIQYQIDNDLPMPIDHLKALWNSLSDIVTELEIKKIK